MEKGILLEMREWWRRAPETGSGVDPLPGFRASVSRAGRGQESVLSAPRTAPLGHRAWSFAGASAPRSGSNPDEGLGSSRRPQSQFPVKSGT